MSFQSILVHVDDGERVVLRIGAAARLARAFDAELIGAYSVPGEAFGLSVAALMPDRFVEGRLQELGEAQNAAEALFRAAAGRARLAAAEWRAPAGDALTSFVEHARCTDLVIIGQPDPDDLQRDFAAKLADATVLESGRPVLVIPYAGAPTAVGSIVLIAWNATRESARAVADAMPLLARAEKVVLLSIVTGGDEVPGEGHAAQRVVNWLRFHGIDVVQRQYHVPDIDVGELLLSQAADLGADLIVMGGYSHSRLQERVLGGVTRLMLETMTVPVLMAH